MGNLNEIIKNLNLAKQMKSESLINYYAKEAAKLIAKDSTNIEEREGIEKSLGYKKIK